MNADSLNLKIVLILMVGFTYSSILGNLAHRFKLSPILGYLIAGYLIGPYSPGYVADFQVAEQLAEIGVILMMFGVGLHFKWKDLVKYKDIAIPGAFGQTLIASLVVTGLIYAWGWSLMSGIVLGLAVGVASTVVLVRMLGDHKLLGTPQGHVTVGWLIVEDIITVAVLVLIPTIAAAREGIDISWESITGTILFILFKFILMIAILFTWGTKIVSYILKKVIKHSEELFTLTILALTFLIAIGSALLFGSSIALGAFIAGMVIGQSNVRAEVEHQASPLKDTFVVIFFLSVGMLFNPMVIMQNFFLFFVILAIILLVKPLAAFCIARGLKYPMATALTAAVALGQIGEFSFILVEEAMHYDLIPSVAYDIVVACALVSIAINPLFFKLYRKKIEAR